jgi:hypothetical protein
MKRKHPHQKTQTMDTNYIINRLKSTPFKVTTVSFLKVRLNNLEDTIKFEILTDLKKQLKKERNYEIQESLYELVYRLPIAS